MIGLAPFVLGGIYLKIGRHNRPMRETLSRAADLSRRYFGYGQTNGHGVWSQPPSAIIATRVFVLLKR